MHTHRLGGALAADAARGRGVEAPLQPLRVELAHPQLDRVRGEVGRERGAERLEPLADREAERELLVVTGRPHRHRDRLAVDADLERLLDRDEVVLARACRQPRDANPRGRARHAGAHVGTRRHAATLAARARS